MMNALRLEMLDEGNVVMNDSIMLGASRPHIVNNVLVQSFYVKSSEIQEQTPDSCKYPTQANQLFSFEKHRSNYGKWACTVHTVPLANAEFTSSDIQWRNCDRHSLMYLKEKKAFDEMKTSRTRLFATEDPSMKNLVDTINKYPKLLNLMHTPWEPLDLKTQETCLYNASQIPPRKTSTPPTDRPSTSKPPELIMASILAVAAMLFL
jgi:hypothetical protein